MTFEQFVQNHPELQDLSEKEQQLAYALYLEEMQEMYANPDDR